MADEMDSAQPAPQGQNPLVQEYYSTTEARRAEAKAQMDKLIRALDSRKNMPFDPMWMRISGALLSPTKTGSFGESLGYAATAGAEEAEKQAARGVDIAKMEFELGEKMRQQQALDDQMKFRMKYFGGKPPAGAPVPAAPTPAAAPAAALPPLTAAQPVAAQEISPVPKMSTPEAPAILPQEMPQAAPPPAAEPSSAPLYVPRQIDPMLAIIDPVAYEIEMKMDKAAREQAEFRLKEREAVGKDYMPLEIAGVKKQVYIPEYQAAMNAVEKGQLDVAKRFYTKYGFPFPYVKENGVYRPKTAAEEARDIELAKSVKPEKFYIRELGGTFEMLPSDYADYRAAKKAGGKDLQAWLNEFSGKTEPSVKPDGRAEPVSQAPKSVSERESEAERRKTFAVKGAEETIKMDQQMAELANTSAETQRSANTILSVITDPKYSGAQGYFSKPGFKNALVTFLKEGIRVGDFNVGMPSFGEALKKLGMSEDEVNAEALLFQKTGNLQLMVSRLQQGQGSVSNYERSVFEKIGGSIDTPLIAMQSSMSALRARAIFDQRNAEAYMKWRDRNPDKDGSRYLTSDEYKAEKRAYEQQLEKIENRFFPKSKPAAPKAESPKAEPKAGGTSKFLQ